MTTHPLDLTPINYSDLNARQKENYNFQKVSAVFAGYGYNSIRLNDDWQGADFIAYHKDGQQSLKVQLKGVLTVDAKKYYKKDIWVCFPWMKRWYIYDHDTALSWLLDTRARMGETKGWECSNCSRLKVTSQCVSEGHDIKGGHTFLNPSKAILRWLEAWELKPQTLQGRWGQTTR